MDTFTIPVRRGSSRLGDARRDSQERQSPQEDGPCVLARSSLLMTQALAAAHSAPDIREDKVAAIKARLAAGTYEIDTMALAEALVNENPGLFTPF